jgi:peptidoglycan-associated lipoprotein
MQLRTVLVAGAALALVIAASGCSKKPKSDATGSGTSGSGEFSGQSGVEGYEMEAPERVPELGTIYFDFDRSDIRADARPTLKANAQAIESHSEWVTITLEGHTDERGTEEYNLALGERRATAAKQYLTDLGVPSARLVTVSFGESAPAVQGHDESAWQWNRRVEFRVTK